MEEAAATATGVDLSRKFVSETELDENRKKRQEEWEKVRKPEDPEGNMVRGLDEDESSFLDEVSRQQSLVEKQRRDEEKQELMRPQKPREPEKKLPSKAEQRTSHLSQAHLLAGAVKRRSSSQSSDSSKKQKVEITKTGATGNGDRQTDHLGPLSSERGVLHLPSAAVCVGVLPGLCVYSGSSDSDSSSDSEGSVDAIMLPYPRHSRA
ncbi:hypothetical protein F7725_022488 [Dissostichus mawsoni]|uniref:FAM192A/Fyv6 N-terminal domain-containing protein n=1 Tax=Dissostichus mawsoni TaxID=36200 RepID=A0A7J5YZ25_DISMA|nr:hypothetical protein F7725_022488 [Dissostichus mawsoni]